MQTGSKTRMIIIRDKGKTLPNTFAKLAWLIILSLMETLLSFDRNSDGKNDSFWRVNSFRLTSLVETT